MFVDRGIEALFAQSYSKNLGLYAGAKRCALPLDSRPSQNCSAFVCKPYVNAPAGKSCTGFRVRSVLQLHQMRTGGLLAQRSTAAALGLELHFLI